MFSNFEIVKLKQKVILHKMYKKKISTYNVKCMKPIFKNQFYNVYYVLYNGQVKVKKY